MEKKNEFKFGILRSFGSEQFTFNATVHSDNMTLTPEEIQGQIEQMDTAIHKAFEAVNEREISEKAILVKNSERRTEEVKKLDDALKAEMQAKTEAGKTMKDAEKLSDKLSKK